jgi:hypothetical protein
MGADEARGPVADIVSRRGRMRAAQPLLLGPVRRADLSFLRGPGAVSPEMQIERLEADYQKARAENKPVPPGFHAHLGFLYFQLGKLDQAKQELETEKAQFPESAAFIDHLLANLRKN